MVKLVLKTIIIVCVFLLGVFSTNIYAELNKEQPLSTTTKNTDELSIKTPSDKLTENQIKVYSSRVILDIKNAEWASFTPTGSMEPVLNENSNAIELVPESEDEIEVGDICSYKSDYATGTIIHRVVYKGQDEKGTYYVFKGDNNPTSDPGRIRFDQVKRCVVAIIY